MATTTISLQGDVATPSGALYRAVWRWHFYAGLLVLPFMISLAITGGLYLFKDEIDGIVYRSYLTVAPLPGPTMAPSAIIADALAAVPGTSTRYVPPAGPTTSAEVGVETADGTAQSVYVDPYAGKVLGSVPDEGKLMYVIKRIHSLAWFGTAANYVIEIVAGWAIVLAITGVYLWWPRGRSGGVLSVRGAPAQRMFWRDLHAVTGLFTAFFVAFLAVTGMPWSVFWGDRVNHLAAETGLGYPTGMWDDVPTSTVPAKDAMSAVPWSLSNAPMPVSTEPVAGAAPIGVDAAVQAFDRLGIAKGYAIDLPRDPTGVYSAMVFPDDLSQQRVIHLDQYSGRPLLDVGVKDYGGVAQAIEWGINVHQGQEFGRLNQLVLATACVAIVLMAVSAAVMWWKRRPVGKLGAPQRFEYDRVGPGIVVIAGVLGLIYPLVGASLLLFLLIDLLLPRGFKRRFGI